MKAPAFVESERKRRQQREAQPGYREKSKIRSREYRLKNKARLSPKWREWQRNWHKTRPESAFNSWLKTRYGIDTQEYRQMLLDQKGRCAICGKLPSKRRLFIDHDHKTNRVRALICEPCNIKLGVYEKTEWMKSALAYLADPPMNKVTAMREEKKFQ
jgi:hypothetical protein